LYHFGLASTRRRHKLKQKKACYYIIYHDEYVGQTRAVSEAQARTNWWWDNVKYNDKFSERSIDPSELEAYRIG
jgi:hypothetical protein